jgi:hypothetical protein
MGIDFSYDFLVRPENAARFLAGVAGICDPDVTSTTTVILADGESVRLPGSYGFADDQTVELATHRDGGRAFDLALMFPEDGPLAEYRAGEDFLAGGSGPVTMAYVYLGVYDGAWLLPGHLIFNFTPAVSSQSRLFLRSPSIRETFATLALSTGTPLCLFDGEVGDRIIVTAWEHRVSTRVPGPCLLWHGGAPGEEAAGELKALLTGHPADPPMWIIGPGRPEFATFVDNLTALSAVDAELWLAP